MRVARPSTPVDDDEPALAPPFFDEKVDGLRVVMDARFSSVERSLDGLDRDVDGLTRRMLGEET